MKKKNNLNMFKTFNSNVGSAEVKKGQQRLYLRALNRYLPTYTPANQPTTIPY